MIKFNWKKSGIIFSKRNIPFKNFHSRAMLPKAIILKDKIRVFYTFINKNKNANFSFFDLDLHNPNNIIYIHKKKILDLGLPGLFDDSGTLCSAIFKIKEKYYLMYNGYKQTNLTPYSINVGLCISNDCKNFKKISKAPILERSDINPYFITSPNVLLDKKIKLYYTSGTGWFKNKKNLFDSSYNIKLTNINSLHNWDIKENITCITHPKQAVASPTVFKFKSNYHMIFCFRGIHDYRNEKNSYQLGYAFSKDGKKWKRKDKVLNFIKKQESWENVMNCYPNTIIHKKKLIMFYNGNNFGEDGIGMSTCDL